MDVVDVVAFTRQLVDIESITGNEAAVGNVLHAELCRLGYQANKLPVEGSRCNVYATSPQQAKPTIVFSTHMDTVPPFIPSSEDASRITVGDHAMPKESSRLRSPQASGCVKKAFTSDFFFW
jgi:putative aminopeptidase FrvX